MRRKLQGTRPAYGTVPLPPVVHKPLQPEPFPSDGRPVKLINCPVCTHAAVPYYYAPKERVYKTQCLDCGAVHVIHPDDIPSWELDRVQREGVRGHGLQNDGYRLPPIAKKVDKDLPGNVSAFEADHVWDEALNRADLGLSKWYRS